MSGHHQREDQVLLEELAGLVERLRVSRYEAVLEGARAATAAGVEEFSDLLSRHLLYEEEILFRALTEAAPDAASGKLDGLKGEHAKLREFAKDLVCRVRRGEMDEACDIGRLFMASLLDHLQKESRVTRQIFLKLHPTAASRLRAKLGLEGLSLP